MSFIRVIQDFFHVLRWNEVDPFSIANNQIAGHYGHASDPYRDIDSGKHDVADGCWIHRTEVAGHIDLRKTVEITDAAVYHQSSTVRGFHHVVEEIVTDDGSVHLFAEKIN